MYEWSVIKRQKSQTTRDCKWLQMNRRDYQWLRVTKSETKSEYKWLRVIKSQTISDFKWLRVT